MGINLVRPIAFLDLETTGIDTCNDRIVQIAIIKIFPENRQETISYLINPEIPIPVEASNVNGITDEMVKNQPTFREKAEEIRNFIINCDLGGYNIHRYDLPLLRYEFLRANITFSIDNIFVIDPQVIFMKKEPRDLTSAYKFYCQKELLDAHNAINDIYATKEIFFSQIEKYNDIGKTIEDISKFSSFSNERYADISRKLKYNENNELVFAFGKYKDMRVIDYPDYCNWMMSNDFPSDTINIIRNIFNVNP